MRTAIIAAILGAGAALTGCSSTDLAAFNVAMQEANGTYWPDQSDSVSHDCASGYGFVNEFSGVSGGEGYLYFQNWAEDGALIEVSFENGSEYSFDLEYGEKTYTIHEHPGYGWNTAWSC